MKKIEDRSGSDWSGEERRGAEGSGMERLSTSYLFSSNFLP